MAARCRPLRAGTLVEPVPAWMRRDQITQRASRGAGRGQAVERQALILVGGVAGDLAPEPVRRDEGLSAPGIVELDLGDDQPVQRPGVDVELDQMAVICPQARA